MADSKHTITINTKATPNPSTPTQTVAPSQVTRPEFTQGERQSMVNKQAHTIRDEQAAQGISIPWGDAFRQANEEWKTNTEAANALADTEHESIINPASQVISDEIVGAEPLEDDSVFGSIDTDSIDSAAIEEALDGIFDNINEVIEGYDPHDRPESNMPAKWWEAEMTPSDDSDSVVDSSDDDDADSIFETSNSIYGEGESEPEEPIVPSGTGVPVEDEMSDAADVLSGDPGEIRMGEADGLSGASLIDSLVGGMPDYGRRFDGGEVHDAMLAGVSSSSPSAATAIQATGALALAPAKAGRDAAASQLEKGALAAKIGVAYATEGEIMPFNEQQGGQGDDGGGGDVVGAAMSMFGGDEGGGGEGGGGGGIDEMVGQAIDDIFMAPLKPIDFFIDSLEDVVDTLAEWTQALEGSFDEVMGFSGAMVSARVETELGLLQKRMERADELGAEFAEFESARGGLLLAFEDLKTVLLKIFMPVVKVGLKIMTKILDIIVWILELINDLKNAMIEMMIQVLEVLAWIPGLGAAAGFAISVLEDIRGNTDAAPTNPDHLGAWLGNPQDALVPLH